MRVLWKAVDGREFVIDTDKEGLKTQEDLMNHIAKLRREHGYEDPTFVQAITQPGVEFENAIDSRDLPEDLRKQVEEAALEALEKPDPKKMN